METSPKEIELIAVKPAGKRQKVDVEITFSTHVGWDGALILFFSLGIAGLFVYITYLYTKQFQAWHREWVWLCMVFAALYTILGLWYMFRWKQIVLAEKVANTKLTQNKRKRSCVRTLSKIKENFSINGPFFLWKLYCLEFVESVNQVLNCVTIYLCALPKEITICMCIVFAIDAFIRAYNLTQRNTVARRDLQVKLDVVMDILCVAVPLCVLWFVYQIPISIKEMNLIILWPSLCLWSKLRTILKEIIRSRADNAIIRASIVTNNRLVRLPSQAICVKQQENIPKLVSGGFCVYNIGYGLFFLVVAVVHLILKPTGCDTMTWEKGCVNKIPFCKNLFMPTCNCASLHIVNDFTLSVLPNSMVDEMQGLRKVFIRKCNLTKLPPKMEQLTEIVNFEVSFNRLKAFDVDVLKWEKLNMLLLDYNDIARYNKEVFWTHTELTALSLASNHIQVPTTGIYMPSLTFLHIGENHATINARISKGAFPSLIYLYLNGNILEQFPDESLKDHLQDLGVARCRLTSLPAYLSKFKRMVYLDARDNNITSVDASLKSLIKANDIESYFSGNTVCKDDNSLDCEPLCSKTCWRRTAPNDGFCDIECNTADCKFDGGDCKF